MIPALRPSPAGPGTTTAEGERHPDPTLFAGVRYDDGVVPWNEDDPRSAHAFSRSAHTPQSAQG